MVILLFIPIFTVVVILFTCFSKNSSSKKKEQSSKSRSPAPKTARSMTCTARSKSTVTATPKSTSNETGSNEPDKDKEEQFKFNIQSSKHTTSENKTNLDSVEGEDNPLLNQKMQAKLRGVPSTVTERKIDETQTGTHFGSAEGPKKTKTRSAELATASKIGTVPSHDKRDVGNKAWTKTTAGSNETQVECNNNV